MKLQKNIMETLKREKGYRHLNMEEFAAELTMSKSNLQNYMKENSNANPTINTLELMAERLGIPIEELILEPGTRQCPPGCKECIRFEIEALHPLLRELAKQQLAALAEISKKLYKREK